ncbi:hypothetical protein SteCoe_35004 [Stentor coeruleus]|uniref:Uncharacterized protein n=1 Tax=Stentor coeruleus TaxID=5963 RepID=A0A1R2ATA0_9CILI|nr:hypothetical protein SteCoe_35004 [Stentor coeruleus]
MALFLVPLGFLGCYYYPHVKSWAYHLWNHKLPRLTYSNGILTETSLKDILKEYKRNLSSSLISIYKSFIDERRQVFNSNLNLYIVIVERFLVLLVEKKNEIFLYTLKEFGINTEEFAISLEEHNESVAIRELLTEISEVYIVDDLIPQNFSIINAIIMINRYKDKLKEQIKEDNYIYEKYIIIDQINQNKQFSELDLSLAFNFYKNSSVMHEIRKQVEELEENFHKIT